MRCHYCREEITPCTERKDIWFIRVQNKDDNGKPYNDVFAFHQLTGRRCYSMWFNKMLNRPPVNTFFR